MADINKLFGALTKTQEQILGAIDQLNTISKEAIGFGGDIARVVPQNLKVSMDQLKEIVNGSGQSSLESIIQYLDNVPVSALRKQSLVKTTINDEGIDQSSSSVEAAINTTPNTSAGAQSAIARESFKLSDFYKEQYKGKVDSAKTMRETGELSFDAVLRENEIGVEYEDLVNGGEAASLNFKRIKEDETEGYAKRFGLSVMNESDFNDEDEYEDDDEEKLEESSYKGTWQDLLYETSPNERDFDDIINDTREPEDLGA